ncbi:MAG: hypothetical protein IKR86_00815 [Candidatus Methanomethylophilaceae archaeon]|nr:hypothetical protein [Candidatus Methanomethylophilaceae archaeon]
MSRERILLIRPFTSSRSSDAVPSNLVLKSETVVSALNAPFSSYSIPLNAIFFIDRDTKESEPEAISMSRSSTCTSRGSSGSTRSTLMESAVSLNSSDLSIVGLLPSFILEAGSSMYMRMFELFTG